MRRGHLILRWEQCFCCFWVALGIREKVGTDEAVRILSRGGVVRTGGPGVLGREACESEEPPGRFPPGVPENGFCEWGLRTRGTPGQTPAPPDFSHSVVSDSATP